MNTKRTFTSQQKAAIVLSIIRGEVTLLEVSKQHDIVPSLLHKWKEHFVAKASSVFDQPKEDIETDRKLKKYEHIITKLTTQNDFLDKVLAQLR